MVCRDLAVKSEMVKLKNVARLIICHGYSDEIAILFKHRKRVVGLKIINPPQGRVNTFERWKVMIGQLQPRYESNTPLLIRYDSYKTKKKIAERVR